MFEFDRVALRNGLRALGAVATFAWLAQAPAQELILTPAQAPFGVPQSRPVVVFPDLGASLGNPVRTYIAPTTSPTLAPHGLTIIAPDRGLVSQEGSTKLDLLDPSAGTRIESYDLPDPIPAVHYDGYGTLAVNPARTHVLAVTDLGYLWVIAAPFDHTASVTTLVLPSTASTAQTRAIAFDSTTGRAYVALVSGIVAIDPPYTSIAFTIASSNGLVAGLGPVTGAIAMSPDNATLVATRGASAASYGPELRIFHAPISAASVPDVLTIAGSGLDGMAFLPDSSKVIVVEQLQRPAPLLPRVFAVAAPFSGSSTFETLSFETGGDHDGFEDIDISADGQLAALSGGGGSGDALVVLKAPFTAAGFSTTLIDIPQFHLPYGGTKGRGDGTARFGAGPIPPLPPQVWVDLASTGQAVGGGVQVTEGNSGTTDAPVRINLSGPSALPVTVNFTTVDGTTVGINVGATAADNDYLPASGPLTFAPGETAKDIVVKVVGDTRYEYDEHFNVVISNPVNAMLLDPLPGFADTGTVVIKNDDAVAPLAITTTALPDGTTGVAYSFQVMGTGPTPLTWSALFFPALPAGLSLDPATGIISGTPTTPGTQAVFLHLVDPVGLFVDKTLDLTINGGGIAVLTPIPSTLDFGNQVVGTTGPSKTSLITNTGSAPLVLGTPFVTVPPGSDFILQPGSCADAQTLAPGEQCPLVFRFKPTALGIRTLTLNLASNAVPATLDLTGMGIAAALPVVSIANAAPVTEGNSGTTPMSFPVTLSIASGSAVTVNYAATGGTATNGVDYTVAGSGTLTFPPGTTAQNVVVNVIGDTQHEPDETVVITLSNPVGATLGNATASGTILDDDPALPVLSLLTPPPNFGSQVVGTASAPITETVDNSGGSNLVLATPFAPIGGADFAAVGGPNACTPGATLAPGASCNLYVVFTPTTTGLRTISVVLASNAPSITLPLMGTGILAAQFVQPVPSLSLPLLAILAGLLALLAWGQLYRRRSSSQLNGSTMSSRISPQ